MDSLRKVPDPSVARKAKISGIYHSPLCRGEEDKPASLYRESKSIGRSRKNPDYRNGVCYSVNPKTGKKRRFHRKRRSK